MIHKSLIHLLNYVVKMFWLYFGFCSQIQPELLVYKAHSLLVVIPSGNANYYTSMPALSMFTSDGKSVHFVFVCSVFQPLNFFVCLLSV